MPTVEQQSSELRQELGLTDLVLSQILYVVGLSWVGTAASKLGTQQIPFWLAAMVLFYVPQAVVVIHLSRRFPLEGGLYQWSKVGLSPAVAFLVGWNLWIYAIILLGAFGLQVSNALIYAIGPSAQVLSGNRMFNGAVSGGLLGGLIVLSIFGLRISKWFHNLCAVLLLLAFALLLVLPAINVARGVLREYHPLAIAAPTLTLLNLNILGKLGLGALSGFEYVAVLAGETRNAQRNIARSVIIAAPIIALMFILGTSSILALTPQGQIDLIGPIPQAFSNGLGGSSLVTILIPFAVMAVTARTIGNSSFLFTATSRMPMVAGWDRMIPAWFSRLHPKYRTPVNSVLFIGGCALVFAAAGMLGVGMQEAFQLLENAGGILYALTYIVLFAIPLVGLGRTGQRAPLWIRIAAAIGLAMAVLYVVLSVLPIVEVESWLVFGLKVGGTVVVANAIGAALYVVRRERQAQVASQAG
ncbi:MAG: APC family permease [Deltaproteobacteria bacterium]|nr:MAG: APC family permease [Deltaproteobacteria bacterium]